MPASAAPEPIEIIAHRGDPVRAPENTLPSLRAAIRAGADAVEWDVRICADGVPVVIHDETVERTTDGAGAVAELSGEELARLDAGGWFGPAHAGARIPTLAEALEVVRPEPVRAYVEVKAVREGADLERIAGEVRAAGMLGRTVVISLDPDILGGLRALEPALPLGWLVIDEAGLAAALAWARTRERAVLAPGAHLLLADPDRTRALVAEGIALGTWTVDDEDEAMALVEMGVTRLTTNRVEELVAWARRVRP